MNTDNATPPRGTNWEKDGIGIVNEPEVPLVIIRMDDTTCMTFTGAYLRDVIRGYTELGRETDRLKDELKYSAPSLFAPDMIIALEKRADECDKNGWTGQAMAYRDTAVLLRKALPK